jgi:hypothetical protein
MEERMFVAGNRLEPSVCPCMSPTSTHAERRIAEKTKEEETFFTGKAKERKPPNDV